MNIRTERDGLEMVNDNGCWMLFLVEDDGTKYTALGIMHDYESVGLLMRYLALNPRYSNDNLREGGRSA